MTSEYKTSYPGQINAVTKVVIMLKKIAKGMGQKSFSLDFVNKYF
jgi:hypothetical protein